MAASWWNWLTQETQNFPFPTKELASSTLAEAITYVNLRQPMKPAASFHPGEYIKDELEARGWSFQEFSNNSGISLKTIKGIIDDHSIVNPEIAKKIGKAFGTSTEIWLSLP